MSKRGFVTTQKDSTPSVKAEKKTTQIKARENNVISVNFFDTFRHNVPTLSRNKREDTLPHYQMTNQKRIVTMKKPTT